MVETKFTTAKQVLPVAAIFGPNASGKSSILSAVAFLRLAVRRSFSEKRDKPVVPRKYFKLVASGVRETSELELTFISDDTLFKFGFECDSKSFVREWLYAYPNNRRQIWYERNGNDLTFGNNLKGPNAIVAGMVRDDVLYLSAASAANHSQLDSVFNFIQKLKIETDFMVTPFEIEDDMQDQELDENAVRFLQFLDTGIIGYEKQPVKRSENQPDEKVLALMKAVSDLTGQDGDVSLKAKEYDVLFKHEGCEDGFLLRAHEESAGSLRLIKLLNSAFKTLESGGVLFVDELDASLHTRASNQVMKLFLSQITNKNGAQLIFTTHDTNLLSDKSLRRDEVWLVEKDRCGQSELYSASEFSLRYSDDLEKVYLDDRMGAVPPNLEFEWFA
ncbi:AAA family ATPase [Hyphomonas johnsonii]|uniref:AAA family ATPase n=1 Tax=Hyphomonas johnsonii TaxID=81031 RepID=UPI00138E0950|nr:ATP-binding protein [Hyphomonas johnsonii]